MRARTVLITLFVAALIIAGCDDTHDFHDDEITEKVRQAVAEAEESIRDAAEEAEDAARESLDEIDRNLDDADDEFDEFDEARERFREEIEDEDFASALRSVGEAIQRIGETLQNDSDIEPVDYRKLRDLLPREINGMERVNTDGARKSALGIHFSKIEADYEGRRRDMTVTIIDLGSLSGTAAAGLDFFIDDFDHDFEDGYERTTEFDGHPAIVKIDNSGSYHHYEAGVLVADRFVVTIKADGRGLDENIVEDVLDEISLRRLERLAR